MLGLLAGVTPQPSELTALLARAHVDGNVSGSCSGEFRAGRPGAFAVAITSGQKSGRYIVIESDASIVELAPYVGAADVKCYSRADAERLSAAIGRSETISGSIAPRWHTTVVCAFVEATAAVCWQYSPDTKAYVKVGGWVT